jgi:lipid-A-disaccharide synthase-like uncharacterized protein
MINLSIIGLSIIVISWIIQFFQMNKRREISKAFLVMYSLGVLFLVIDAFKSNQIDFAVINTLSMIVAIAVLIKFCKPKK